MPQPMKDNTNANPSTHDNDTMPVPVPTMMDNAMLTLTTTAPLPHLKYKMEGTNFFHCIFYFIIYMLAHRHLALWGALSTLEYQV